jgi:hypothetical protein
MPARFSIRRWLIRRLEITIVAQRFERNGLHVARNSNTLEPDMGSRLPLIAVDRADFPRDRFRASCTEALTGCDAILISRAVTQPLLEQHRGHPNCNEIDSRPRHHRRVAPPTANAITPLIKMNASYATASRIPRMNTVNVTTESAAKTRNATATDESRTAPLISARAALTA